MNRSPIRSGGVERFINILHIPRFLSGTAARLKENYVNASRKKRIKTEDSCPVRSSSLSTQRGTETGTRIGSTSDFMFFYFLFFIVVVLRLSVRTNACCFVPPVASEREAVTPTGKIPAPKKREQRQKTKTETKHFPSRHPPPPPPKSILINQRERKRKNAPKFQLACLFPFLFSGGWSSSSTNRSPSQSHEIIICTRHKNNSRQR